MVKFRDLNNADIHSTRRDNGKNGNPAGNNSRLSFRKLAAEQKKSAAEPVVADKTAVDQDRSEESGKVLYQKASAYLKHVLESVRKRKKFPLDTAFDIVREIVDIQSFQDTLLIEALHFDDPLQFIINNNVNVAIYAIKMAENLGWNKDQQIEIGVAGLLHDIGMGLIPEKLLFKHQRLSKAEFDIFKERSNYSYKILKTFGDEHAYLADCAIQVNERLDGSGYPQALKGDEIHEYAQVIGLVDMYEALVHSRPQREKFHHFTAVKEIIKSGKNFFQRRHLKALLNIFSIFPLQSYVRLNSNAIGKVIRTYPDQPMRPKIQIIFDSQHKKVLTERIVNLPEDPLLYIVDSVFEEELAQIAEGTDREIRAQPGLFEEDAGAHAAKKTAATEDESRLIVTEAAHKDQTEPGTKTRRVKVVLIAAAIILLLAGLLLQLRPKSVSDHLITQTADKAPQSGLEKISARPQPALTEVSLKEDATPAKSASDSFQGGGADKTVSPSKESDAGKGPEAAPSDAPLQAVDFQDTKTPEPGAESINLSYPYSIKIDAVTTREEAEAFIDLYRKKGFLPYWVKVDLADRGIWYRIFTGYFESAEAAEKLIKDQNLSGASVKKTGYATLIGTYSSEADLNARIQSLSEKGFSPYVIRSTGGQNYLYVGAFYTRKGAADQYAELRAKSIHSKIVER